MNSTIVDFKHLQGSISQDWEIVNVESFCSSIADGTHDSPKPAEQGYPLITSKNLKDGKINWEDVYLISEADYRAVVQRSWVEEGDILFGMIGTIGNPVILTKKEAGIATKNVGIFRFGGDLIKSRWLFLMLESPFILKQIKRSLDGSTQKFVSLRTLRSLLVRVPQNCTEMERVAEILDTIDEAIAHTSSIIAKLKQIKSGLLHDLLTRGLDENGELRDAIPSVSAAIAHPEQFKDSPLGSIPKDWEVFELSEVVPRAEYGISVSLEDEVGIPVLRMNNLKNGEIDLTDLKKSGSRQAANLLLQGSDVLFNRTNSIEHVGRTAIWRGQISPASFASYLVRLVPDTSRLIHEYLNIWLNLPATQLLIRRYATPGVHQVNINPTNLRKVLIALPKEVSEQKQIVEKITVNDTRIRREEAYLEKLKLQKKGLMHDLLTGKVRVNQVKNNIAIPTTA
ncbi:restriction endonuclease subunit S [Anabaenopsis sp. FSS-46]|uniref:restriction endonuclease subunit S n=1 Tax=Anabaenopsis sp. FSS-46 TaxID=2971766 RepID=UPI0024755750|nr:restriction endonuclease subunit S [Anabaenopsis sp. FSS-46]MDH6100192.1 restriction endonuclease subunit S [Anabaenopsis sp. FSS-46]